MERRERSLVAAASVLLFIISSFPSNASASAHGQLSSNDTLWESIYKYEGYVTGFENATYGYQTLPGYPMYLFNFGFMYHELFLHTGAGYYESKFLRAVEYAGALRNPDWTWSIWGSTWRCILYNWQAVELFVDAWRVTGDAKYRDWAKGAAYGITNTSDFGITWGTYDGHFLASAAVAFYVHETGDRNASLIAAGKGELAFSLSGYDPLSGRWYYDTGSRAAGTFNARAAYYGFGLIGIFLYWESAFMDVYPDEYAFISKEAPKVVYHGRDYLLPTCTWWYASDVPDYTEGAADAIVGFYLFQKRYREDYSDVIACAQSTILSRQASNGGYYKTVNNTTVEIWYTDNIGVSLPWYLNRVSTSIEKAQGFTYILNSNHIAPEVPKIREKVIERGVLALGKSCHLPHGKGGYANEGGATKVSLMIRKWVRPEFQDFFIAFANWVCEPKGTP